VDLTDEGIGQVVHDLHQYEPNETRFLRERLRPGMTFVDIGANIGFYTLLGSRCVGGSGHVLAVEPEPYNRSLLCRNVARNQLNNVQVKSCALSAEPGTAILRRSDTNFGDHRVRASTEANGDETISLDTFDHVLLEAGLDRPDVVKMDTQGYECHIVRGMKRFLEDRHPAVVLTEYWPYGMRQAGGNPGEFLTTFADHGFAASVLNREGGLVASTVDSIDKYLPPEEDEPGGSFLNLVFSRD
jgi:FkbM family methyltransferase